MLSWIRAQIEIIRRNRLTRSMLRYFDWPLLIIVLLISLFGIVCVFSATSSEVTEYPSSIMQMLETQSTYYPSLQFRWLLVGIVMMFLIAYPPYQIFARWSTGIYIANISILFITLLLAEVGRGGMTAFLTIGSSSQSFQPSELGKVAMIICFAKVFSDRKRPIKRLHDLVLMGAYMAIPMVLIILQPDVGTAMVYVFVFAVLVFVSGTDAKLLFRIIAVVVIVAIPAWYYLQNTASSGNFRFTRILIWLDPESYPDDARQVINAQIAVGSGGLFGRGVVSPGSFASLGYISDDHTDFIFAIVCESFGLVGGCLLVVGYILMLVRMIVLAMRTDDPYGAYVIFGVMAMLLAHIMENLCMVIGLLPVTGIPLPFVSYGGSNLLTNMASIGLVENVVMRTRYRSHIQRLGNNRAYAL